MKKLIVGTVTVTTLALGVGALGVGTAFGAPAGSEATAAHAIRRGAVKAAAEAAAQVIGVDVTTLRQAVRGGQSVAAVAQSKGVAVAAVTSAVVATLTARVDQAVQEGKVDAARAEKAKARLPELAERLVNRVPKAKSPAATT